MIWGVKDTGLIERAFQTEENLCKALSKSECWWKFEESVGKGRGGLNHGRCSWLRGLACQIRVWSFPLELCQKQDDPIGAEMELWALLEDGGWGTEVAGDQQNSWEPWQQASGCAVVCMSAQAQ